jgi:tRNA pseudouridine38-40 synthase
MSGEARRIRLVLHYDGRGFYGWQLQPRRRTVQGELEAALARLLQRPCRVRSAGRTDRGVHALGQVATVDVPPRWDAATLRRALNAVLPEDLWVAAADEVPPSFHPRFDAIARSYRYRIGTVEEAHSPLVRFWCWPLARSLDLARLRSLAADLLGEHDFSSLARPAPDDPHDHRCVVVQADWCPWPPYGVELRITANRFLHHMVRYLVGTAVAIALGQRRTEDWEALLRATPGLVTSPPAPAQGLILTRVYYPGDLVPGRAELLPTPP